MPWKPNWQVVKPATPRSGRDLFLRVRKEINSIHSQGELPSRSRGSFSKFICELCTTPYPLNELRQCVLCGRWACTSCWTPEYYVCNSCHGIIRLHMLERKQ